MSGRAADGDPMKMRAAVLEEFGQPLVVQEVELDEPRAGEVLVRLAACGVCHTDLYTASGADPSGYAPTVLGHEGAGVVERVGADVASLSPGDHVVTLFSPQCRECVHCVDPRTNLCMAIRDQQNLGFLPDGTTRICRDGEEIRHFMGCSTFAEYTVMPEIALAKIDPEAPFEHACLFACGLSTGLGAAINTAEGASPARPASSSAPAWSASAPSPAAACRAPSGSSASTSPRSGSSWPRGQGATETMLGGEDTVERDPRDDRRLRRRLHLRGDRQRRRDAPGGRSGADGLGPLHGRRRRRQGRDPRRRPAAADHRPPYRAARPSAGSRAAIRFRRSSIATWRARSTSLRSSRTGSRSTRSIAASS